MTYPSRVVPQITIMGVDVTNYVDLANSRIINVFSRQISTLELAMSDVGSLGILDWQEVIFYDTATSTKLFAGYTQTGNIKSVCGGTRLDVSPLRCADYSCLADHIFINPVEYVGPITDKVIIADIFSAYDIGCDGSTYVQALQTYPEIQWSRQSLRQLLDLLAANANAGWYVDCDMCLHFFFQENGNHAPFGLSDNPDNIDLVNVFPVGNVVRSLDGTGVVNRVTVVGSDVAAIATPILLRMTNETSLAAYGGMYLDGVISDQDIVDLETAAKVASGYLDAHASGSTTFTMDCYQTGLRAGMLIQFESLAHSFNGLCQIQRVTTGFKTGGYAAYNLEIGPYRQDLSDILVALARRKSLGEYTTEPITDDRHIIFKTVDEVVNNSNVPQYDDELLFPVLAFGVYKVTVHMIVVDQPADAGVDYTVFGVGCTWTGVTISVIGGSFAPTDPYIVELSGTLTVGGADTVVHFCWAQYAAKPHDTVMKAGSWLQWA